MKWILSQPGIKLVTLSMVLLIARALTTSAMWAERLFVLISSGTEQTMNAACCCDNKSIYLLLSGISEIPLGLLVWIDSDMQWSFRPFLHVFPVWIA